MSAILPPLWPRAIGVAHSGRKLIHGLEITVRGAFFDRPYHSQQQVSAKEEEQTNNPPSWNPFDLDDHSFGLHFDELPRRRGSASSKFLFKSV